MAADITIVGAGLLGAWHLSREAEVALRAARVVLYSDYNAGIADHVRALNPTAAVRSTDAGEYAPGMYRPEMYQRMARVVLDAAGAGPGVVVLCPGSAMVVDRVTQLVLAGARDAALGVRVLPGISSVESVLAEVGYDAASGLQVVLAQKLVLHGVALNPALAALVLQPAYYDTLYFAGAPRSRPGRFDALAAQLGRTLSPDAPMALVVTPTAVDAAASVFWFRLGALGRLHRALSPRHTLFVPPERAAPTDAAFEARATSWAATLASVEVDDRGAVAQQTRRELAAGLRDLAPELQAESAVLAARWRARPR